MKEVQSGGLFPARARTIRPHRREQPMPLRLLSISAALSREHRPLQHGDANRHEHVRFCGSFNYPVGLQQDRLRNRDPERFGRF